MAHDSCRMIKKVWTIELTVVSARIKTLRKTRRAQRESELPPNTSEEDEMEIYNTIRKRKKRGPIETKKVLHITGTPVSQWKVDDLLGTYDLCDPDPSIKETRPIYKVSCVFKSSTRCHMILIICSFYENRQHKLIETIKNEMLNFFESFIWLYCDLRCLIKPHLVVVNRRMWKICCIRYFEFVTSDYFYVSYKHVVVNTSDTFYF